MNSEKILRMYESSGSIRATARELGLSHAKVRKALLTLGAYETELTHEISALWAQGLRYAEIAQELNISKSWVYANTPYEKGMYNSDTPTQNALKIRQYKERKKKHAQNDKDGLCRGIGQL